MFTISRLSLTKNKDRSVRMRSVIKISSSLIRIRFLVVRIIEKMLLGPIASNAPYSVIRSLDENSHDAEVKKHIADKKQICREKFEYYDFPDSYPPQFRRYKSFERKSIFLLKDVVASPFTGAIWLPEGKLLQESVGSLGRLMGWGKILHDTCLPLKLTSIESQIVCCPPVGYYHWLVEVMPNLINAVNVCPNAKVLLSVESPAYIRQALALLFGDGYTKRLVVSDAPVQVMRIAMPQFEEHSGYVRLEDIETLRKTFLSEKRTLGNSPTRIYVSRSRTARRSMGNEKEVEKVLLREGVEIVHLEELAFEQQIELFNCADEIIAPHGAGLANLVWAEPFSRVLEIFPHRFFNDCYARLSVSRSLAYDYFSCSPDAHSHGYIDVDKITSWLDLPR